MNTKYVGKGVRKLDAMQLVTGQPVYMDDMIRQDDCLIVKLLRSPHANAIVNTIDTTAAMKVPGIEVIYTWEDIDRGGGAFYLCRSDLSGAESEGSTAAGPPCAFRGRSCGDRCRRK